jgi:hypothetical protein
VTNQKLIPNLNTQSFKSIFPFHNFKIRSREKSSVSPQRLFAVDHMKNAQNNRVLIELEQDRLFHELERLKQKLGLGHELELRWLPGGNEKLCGEVKGTCIYIYEEREEKAVETLRHEFFDYLISKTVEPYEKIANKLISLMNDEAYMRKEKLVEVLAALI